MGEKKTFFQRLSNMLDGKGFYIVLFVCVAVIGVSAWILLSTGNIGSSRNAPVSGPELNVTASAVLPPVVSADDSDASAFAPNGPDSDGAVQPSVTPYVSPSPKPSVAPSPKASSAPSASSGNKGGNSTAVSSTDTENGDNGKQTFEWPAAGDIAVGYALDTLEYDKTMGDWRVHPALDIAGSIGTKVVAVADGVVKDVYNDDLLGTTVVIEHAGGLTSSYSNLAGTPTVQVGDKVTMGAVIGAIGDTALGETNEVAHLHLAMALNGASVDPDNYLPKR